MSFTEEQLAVIRGDGIAMERKLTDWRERSNSNRARGTLEDAVRLLATMREALAALAQRK